MLDIIYVMVIKRSEQLATFLDLTVDQGVSQDQYKQGPVKTYDL